MKIESKKINVRLFCQNVFRFLSNYIHLTPKENVDGHFEILR